MKTQFIAYYFNALRTHPLFKEMETVCEDSEWHQERNVLVHTDMVLAEYFTRTSYWSHHLLDSNNRMYLLGAFALAFHDVGKPQALIHNLKEGKRNFAGHEQISARMWEDWIMTNREEFESHFFALSNKDVFTVGWLIEHHLPYKLVKSEKLAAITNTLSYLGDGTRIAFEIFATILRSDAYGRISIDHQKKKADVEMWIHKHLDNPVVNHSYPDTSSRTCYILIGPSGCGKTTFTNKIKMRDPHTQSFSMDEIRLRLYSQDYAEAFRLSTEDSQFANKVQKEFSNLCKTNPFTIIVDNTNLTKKRRRMYSDIARQNGYVVVGVLFPVALQTVIDRQTTRGDKNVPVNAVMHQYFSLGLPSIGEVDYIQL